MPWLPAISETGATLGSRDAGAVLLRASGLKKSFGGETVLDGIDLELRQGEVVLLRGENGSGKTTLLNILTGNLEPDAGEIHYSADDTPRSYRFPRRWWQELNPWDHFRPEFVAMEGMGRTWQDVRLFHSLSLRDNIAVAEPGHPGENPLVALLAPSRANRREAELNSQADAMLARLGLAGRESSSGDMVSLGQSKRVAIARAVAAGAKILFLDEPLAGLDRQGITDVLTLLESLVREENLTLVIVEHVFNFVHLHHLVNVHWMLENGRLTPNHADPIPQQDSNDGFPVTIAPPSWFSQLAGSPEHVTSERLPRGATLTRIRRTDRWKLEAKPVLEIKGLIVNRGVRTVIGLDEHGDPNGFDLTLHEGEIAILQAPNGWGKSTLFDALCGNAPSKCGTIVLNGSQVESTPPWIRAQSGLAASPSAAKLFPCLKVSEVAHLAPRSTSAGSGSIPFAERAISSLSGGEKQRTLLRFAFPDRENPHLILLDEPFAALDEDSTTATCSTIIGALNSAILICIPGDPARFANTHPPMLNNSIPDHTASLFAHLSDLSNQGPYSVSLPDPLSHLDLVIHPHVCPLLPSTTLFLNWLATQKLDGKNMLDFGTGAGSLAIAAIKFQADHVDAIDNTQEAVNCAIENVQLHQMDDTITVFRSDGFEKVDKRYDLILANLPIIHSEADPAHFDFGLLDECWMLHDHFLSAFKKHLTPGGKAVVCHTPLQEKWSFSRLEDYFISRQASFEIVSEEKRDGIPWRLYALS